MSMNGDETKSVVRSVRRTNSAHVRATQLQYVSESWPRLKLTRAVGGGAGGQGGGGGIRKSNARG